MIGAACCSQAIAATPQQVQTAIDNAKTYLYSQEKNSTWEEVPTRLKDDLPNFGPPSTKVGQWGGVTALATYALLAAGESPADPRLAPAIDFLKKNTVNGIYAAGVRSQVWTFLPQTLDVKNAVRKDAAFYLANVSSKGATRGLYTYGPGDDHYHNSPSQYGVLGMWACAQMNIEVPETYWQFTEDCWKRSQQPDGGWTYHVPPDPGEKSKASMTAAGVATLFITQDMIHGSEGLSCTGNIRNDNIERGLKWMGDHFQDLLTDDEWYTYTWYGVERIGVASGYKYFGTNDWFNAGADLLIPKQEAGGKWTNRNYNPTAITALALLFLTRGRAPVIINKLEYGQDPQKAHWNQRPRDAANFVKWFGHESEQSLNWQITGLNVPAEELHDSPILLITGNEALTFTPEESAKLKTFVEQGGMIVANADCAAPAFSTSFRKLGKELFPDYEFRELPEDHLFFHELYAKNKWRQKVSAVSLSNGVRELMVLLPQMDIAKAWQINGSSQKPEAFEFMANVVSAAADGKANFRYKGDTYIVSPNAAIKPAQSLSIARLQYAGNWNPEPYGWQRLATVMHNQGSIELDTKPIPLGEGSLMQAAKPAAAKPSADELHTMAFKRLTQDQIMGTEGDSKKLEALIQTKIQEIQAEQDAKDKAAPAPGLPFKIAHLTGTDEINFTPAQCDELKRYVDAGGLLFIDAAGGSGRFAASVEAMLLRTFGDAAKQLDSPLPADNALYTAGGGTLGEIAYRRFARSAVGQLKTPRLRAITFNGRIGVIYSKEDLSAGLVGENTDGIIGYDPVSAITLAEKVVTFGAWPN